MTEEYRAILDQTSATAVALSDVDRAQAIARVQAVFLPFSVENVRQRVREAYADDAYFQDTLKAVRGIDAIEEYMAESADQCESCTVDFEDVVASGLDVYMRWTMHIRFKKLRRGTTCSSIGMTQLRFDENGRVLMHQDFWDSGANVFELIPVLGGLIRFVKRRI